MSEHAPPSVAAASGGQFPVTRWTRVHVLRSDPDSAEGQRALSDLCRIYWYPLYSFARRKGQLQADAQDMVQGFFAKMLERNAFAKASADEGKMRTYLLTLFTRHMADEWARTQAQKRGGGQDMLTLDFEDGEERFSQEPRQEGELEKAFDRAWAQSVILQTARLLEQECQLQGKKDVFQHLSPLITSTGGSGPLLSYEELEPLLGIKAATLRQTVHRLRARFRDLLRQTISDTLASPTEQAIDAELQALRAAVV
jgi:RNA polymerase sigma factor (sigma-70 family)